MAERSLVYEVPSKEERRIIDYDFRRPQRFSRDQLETIEGIYTIFGQTLTDSIVSQTRLPVEVKLDGIRQFCYGEFISSLPNPTCLGIVDMDPWSGSSLIEVTTSIILTIIDRQLGGPGECKEGEVRRELTEIEIEVTKGILGRMLENLRIAWADVDESLNWKLKTIMTDPRRVELLPLEEVVLIAVLSIKIGRLEGMVRHCIPYNLLEPIAERLVPDYKYSMEQKTRMSPEVLERLRQNLGEAPMLIIAELGTAQISVGDLLGLQIGDVLKLTTRADGDLILKVGNQKKFLCRPGLSGNRVAVQITRTTGRE